MKLDLATPRYRITGQVRFHSLTPLSYSAMGPFSLLPFMQCSHEVLSLCHTVEGTLLLNGKPLVFHRGIGYIEKDRGTSFPSQYFWTQCNQSAGGSQSIFMSAAHIPIGKFSFTRNHLLYLYGGRQYRLATYLGAKVLRLRPQTVIVRQGKKYLRADVLKVAPHPLQAPMRGGMSAVSRKVSAVKCGIGFMPDPIYCWTRYAKMPAMNMSPQTGNQPNNSFFQRILEEK